MRLGVVDFLNAFPLYYALENQPDVTLVRDVPSRLSEMLATGELDAALISSIEYRRGWGHYKYHPNLCVAAKGSVESIRLFVGPSTTANSIRLVRGDYASRSSQVMACLAAGPLSGNAIPPLINTHPPYDDALKNLVTGEALLLIGDPALSRRHLPSIDLGKLYLELTGRAFVYAIWVYKNQDQAMNDRLREALETANTQYEDMLLQAVERFGFSLEFTRHYLQELVCHTLTPKLEADMAWFFEQAEKHQLL